ncbi:MAG: hypothetical protein HRT71_08970 [Flavobacteriales bacterium]|nr:hypothetical protein [Flavobacteriales bacterium]
MKAFKNLLIFLFVVIALFISFALVVEHYYGEEVKDKLVLELSKKLNTDVKVKEAHFSLIKKFPYATLELSDVMVEETFIKMSKDKDTLLFAKRLFLQFNVIDIYTKNYNINNIELENGFMHIHIDKTGETNYNFWKMAEDSLDVKKNVKVELEELILVNMDIRYISDINHQNIHVNAKYAEIEGQIAREKFVLNISSDLDIDWLKIGKVNYVDQKEAWVDVILNVDSNVYTFQNGEIYIADLLFNIDGTATYQENNTELDLRINGSELDIQSALSILPNVYSKEIKKYQSSGKFYFKSEITGFMSNSTDPSVVANFGIVEGTVSKKGSPQELENVTLIGKYTNGTRRSIASSVLDLTDFSFTIGEGKLGGILKLTNLHYPKISAELIGSMEMAKAQEFFRLDTLEIARGNLKINAVMSGRMVDDKNTGGLKMVDLKTEGSLDAENVDIRLVGTENLFREITGHFIFNDNDLMVENLSFKLEQSDFHLDGFFRNMAQFVIDKDAKLSVKAKLKSKVIDFNYILRNTNKTDSTKSDTGYALDIPRTINLNLDVEIDSIMFRKFNAERIKGKIQLKNRIITANPLSFETMQGSVEFEGVVDGRNPNAIIITCSANLDQLNINQLFYQFENFGQNTLQAHNIMGRGTADLHFASIWDAQLNIDLDRILAKGNIKIEDGELINYAPMMELSDYIDVEELKHIKFSSMENKIDIKNQTISIPKTEIKCTALNLNLEGNHTFNNEIDYKFDVQLDEVLSKKVKKSKNKIDYEEYEDGTRKGLTIYITMEGTVDNPIIKTDKKQTFIKIAHDLFEEKLIFQQMVKEEFNIFKKDTTEVKKDVEEEKEKEEEEDDSGWGGMLEFDPDADSEEED